MMLAALLGLPKQSEILIIIFLGICFLSLDFSLFEIRSNLEQVWQLQLDKAKNWETVLKYIISAVVLARTFTLHAFLACYVVMLWPAIFEEKPNLMLPWLFLGIIRCLFLNIVTFTVGTFICHNEKGLSLICHEYILAQVIEHGPSVYAWISVLSFYRELVGERDPNQPSDWSLLSEHGKLVDGQESDEMESSTSLKRSKCYSLSDLNLDYMNSNRFKKLSASMPMEDLLEELGHLVSKTRITRDSSKSFNSLHHHKSDRNLEAFETLSSKGLSIVEEAMKILEISERDIEDAQHEKDKFAELLKEVSVKDVDKIDDGALNKITSSRFYTRNGETRKGIKTHIPKSLSLHDETKSDTCMCSLRRKLLQEQSKLTLIESEIANIEFDELDEDTDKNSLGESNLVESETKSSKGKCKAKSDLENCKAKSELKNCEAKPELKNCEKKPQLEKSKLKKYYANCKKITKDFGADFIKNDIPNNLNKIKDVLGNGLGFNTIVFLQKFALKKNATNNFGCQVSLLKRSIQEGSKNEFDKKLEFLRNFQLL